MRRLISPLLTVALAASPRLLLADEPHGHVAQATSLFQFRNSKLHERDPEAPLTVFEGALYGTARFGGNGRNQDEGGTVFRIDPQTGAETTIYSFSGGVAQGFDPDAGLTAVGGQLFGTTAEGHGSGHGTGGIDQGFGTVFRLDPATGKLTLLHGFNGSDGSQPSGSLAYDGAAFYGTTWYGGAHNTGTVFKIDAAGQFETVYQFPAPSNGCQPVGLIVQATILYGATKGCGAMQGGTIFSINLRTGSEIVLHAFDTGGVRAAEPSGNLLLIGDSLYGTAMYGGAADKGVVFKLDVITGKYTVLHDFIDSDGKFPASGVVQCGGLLYGVTETGGAAELGTVFSIDPATGRFATVYSFDGTVGDTPLGGLVASLGALFGTTLNQYGDYRGGVFKLVP
jgi:uncharacterized repeat protein (TIGR03803 family)